MGTTVNSAHCSEGSGTCVACHSGKTISEGIQKLVSC
jgi:hypothetical protein